MASPVQSVGGGAGADSSTAAASAKAADQKNTFLTLLVAQIKNQDPLAPADGIQFVSQLAQFSQLEQVIDMRDDIAAIRQALDGDTKPADTGA